MDINFVLQNLKLVKEVEPNWYKLGWRFIKNGTYNIYIEKYFGKSFGIMITKDNTQGVGWTCKGLELEISLYWSLHIWIKYNFICNYLIIKL